MSGIVGSYHNIRGSGIVNKLGTDGQVFTSTGVGGAAGFEDAAGGGKIGQVVQTLKTDGASTTSQTYATTGLAVAITPVATSSKVLIHVNFGSLAVLDNGRIVHTKIVGGNCATYIGDAGTGYESAVTVQAFDDQIANHPVSMLYLDAPSTTSEVTYTVHWCVNAYTGWINVVGTPNDASGNTASTITALEVLA